ncbi:MAG: VCBS repeat-containing protein [Candidatus Omnitrophota bacterium]|nr:MAG: VCBS repeat-containing protein [Candidatus Omnitrophota bacterium]
MHKHFNTDLLTGSASFNLPVALPPGRKGVQPNISLVYSSTNNNGWCGVGWDLSLGFIQRSTKRGIPVYDDSDTFLSSFNGLNSELVNIGGLEYRAKLESQFLRFFYNSAKDFWEVTDKNGTKYFFGLDNNSRLSSNKRTFKWCLNKMTDIHGNYMSISYIKHEGQIYPRQIAYTGNERTGELPKCSVDFILQDRKDISSSYRFDAKMQTNKRLYQLDIKVNAVRTRKYVLDYIYSKESKRSLLSSLAQYGADGTSALPPITFNYQSGGRIVAPAEIPQVSSGDNVWNIKWSGVNSFPAGDMILYPELDLIIKGRYEPGFEDGASIKDWGAYYRKASGKVRAGSWSSDTQNGNFQCQVAEGNAFCISTYRYVSKSTTVTLSLSKETNPACFLNGEYVEPRYSPKLYLEEGFNLIELTGYSQSGGTAGETFMLSGVPTDVVELMSKEKVMFSSPVGDFNGDGRTDIASYDNLTGRWEAVLSQGETFGSSKEWWVDTTTSNYCMSVGGDFNGDGRTDVGTHNRRSGKTDIAFSNGSKFNYVFSSGSDPDTLGIPFTGDFNGDGLTDIGYAWSDNFHWMIFLSDGSTFSDNPNVRTYGSSRIPVVGDFNGDGLADLCKFDYFEGWWSVALSPGKLSVVPSRPRDIEFSTWLRDFAIEKTPLAADFNNDGMTDVGFFDKDIGRWEIALSDGTKFIPAGIWLDNFGKGAIWVPQCGDFNGDGLLDAGIFNTTGVEGCREVIAYAQGSVPDLLFYVSNGLGGDLTITYKASTQFENTFLPFPVQAVDSVTRDDGLGHRYTTNYTYANGFYDAKDREFRGFGYVKTNDPEGNIAETWFHLDDIFKGRAYKQRISDSLGNKYQEVLNSWEKINPYSGHSEISFPYLASEDSYTYDGDKTSKQSRITYKYDDYGNISTTVNYGEVDGSVDKGADKRSIYNKYVYNEKDRILNRVSHTYTDDYQGNKVSERWLYYDGQDTFTDSPILGNLTKEERWLSTGANLVTTMEYDEYGNCISTTDARGNKTTTSYEKVYYTYPESVTNALGHIQSFTYEASIGQLLTSTDVNNNTTRNEYDEFGRLSRVFGPGDDNSHPRIWYEYDLESFPTKVITYTREKKNSHKVLSSYTFYDGLGRAIQTRTEAEDPAKHILKDTVSYNSKGQIKKKWLPYFVELSSEYIPPDPEKAHAIFEYDPLGRGTLSINPDGTSTCTTYSDWVSEVTDENGHRKRFTKDAYGNLIKVEEFNGTEIYLTSYIYDALDNLTFITDTQGNTSAITYDSLSRKIAMDDADMGHWEYNYDPNGNLIKQTDAKGQIIEFEYDKLNRPINKLADGQAIAAYHYNDDLRSLSSTEIEALQAQNKIGRLDKVVYPSGSSEFSYDEMGRETERTNAIDSATFTIERTYDLLDRLTSLTYPDGEKVNYIYNRQGQIEKVEGKEVYVLNIDYNASNQMTNIEYGNGTHSDYQYNPKTLRLAGLKTNDGGLQDLSYQFDNIGNITGITDSVNSATQSFQYDDLNRLTDAQGSYGKKTYKYDPIGNMKQKGDMTFTYGENGAGPHALTSSQGGESKETISYDANGNMISKNEAAYHYDTENRLIEVSGSSSTDSLTVELELVPQWNFISLPVIPDSWDLDTILSALEYQFDYDQVARYNPEDASFEYYCHHLNFNQFDQLQYGRGYQLYITNPSGCKLTITGKTPASEGIALSSGWNLIGAPTTSQITVTEALSNLSRNRDYDRIVRYNPNTKSFTELTDSDNLKAGKSYFIHMLQPVTWTLPSKYSSTTFAYDNEGNRIKKVSSEGTTIYVGDAYEIENNIAVKHIFVNSNRICSIRNTDGGMRNTDYYHSDHLGSSNVITDGSGNKISSYEYTPYGSLLLDTSDERLATNYLFTGKELDQSTGLLYFDARYYDATLARFITPDPLIWDEFGITSSIVKSILKLRDPSSQTTSISQRYATSARSNGFALQLFLAQPQRLNRYAYCNNNPLKLVDPTGEWGIPGMFVGAVSGAVGGYITSGNWKGVLTGAFVGAVIGFVNPWASYAVGSAIGAGVASTAGQMTGNYISGNPLFQNFSPGAVIGSSLGAGFTHGIATAGGAFVRGSITGHMTGFGGGALGFTAGSFTEGIISGVGTGIGERIGSFTEGIIGGMYNYNSSVLPSPHYDSFSSLSYSYSDPFAFTSYSYQDPFAYTSLSYQDPFTSYSLSNSYSYSDTSFPSYSYSYSYGGSYNYGW